MRMTYANDDEFPISYLVHDVCLFAIIYIFGYLLMILTIEYYERNVTMYIIIDLIVIIGVFTKCLISCNNRINNKAMQTNRHKTVYV